MEGGNDMDNTNANSRIPDEYITLDEIRTI